MPIPASNLLTSFYSPAVVIHTPMVAADSPIAAAVLIADWTAGAVGPVAWSARSRWQWAGSRSPQGRFHILEHARHLTSMRAPWPRPRSSRKAWFRISCSYPLAPRSAFRRLGNPRPICWCNPSTRPMAWCKGGGNSAPTQWVRHAFRYGHVLALEQIKRGEHGLYSNERRGLCPGSSSLRLGSSGFVSFCITAWASHIAPP